LPAPGRGPLEELLSVESDEQLAAAPRGRSSTRPSPAPAHYRDGLPHAQIAGVLGIAVNSVGPLLDRARERLQKKIN
jgi:DNA-directed RNA polymerase specialized sigma24 family protein